MEKIRKVRKLKKVPKNKKLPESKKAEKIHTPAKTPKIRRINTSKIEKSKRKVKKYYKKQQCAFVKADGTQCKCKAVGKSTLCEKHGGDAVIKENLYTGTEELMLPNCRVKFNPAHHPLRYIELARDGLSEVEIAAEFEIATITLQDWSEKFESFYLARDIGKAMHEAWWLRQGKDNMNDRSFNTPLFKYMTMNKLGYSDKIEQKSLNMNVHGVLMVPDTVTEEDWENDEEVFDV